MAHEEKIQSMKTMTKREKDEDKNGNKSYKKNILPTLVVVGLLFLSLGWVVYAFVYCTFMDMRRREERRQLNVERDSKTHHSTAR